MLQFLFFLIQFLNSFLKILLMPLFCFCITVKYARFLLFQMCTYFFEIDNKQEIGGFVCIPYTLLEIDIYIHQRDFHITFEYTPCSNLEIHKLNYDSQFQKTHELFCYLLPPSMTVLQEIFLQEYLI